MSLNISDVEIIHMNTVLITYFNMPTYRLNLHHLGICICLYKKEIRIIGKKHLCSQVLININVYLFTLMILVNSQLTYFKVMVVFFTVLSVYKLLIFYFLLVSAVSFCTEC